MRIFVCVLSLLALLPLGGCGGSEDGRLPTYKVSGTVKYKGKLVENADVILQFAEHNKTSFGRTNSSGEFALTTYENADGALAGEALITVTKWEELPASTQARLLSQASRDTIPRRRMFLKKPRSYWFPRSIRTSKLPV